MKCAAQFGELREKTQIERGRAGMRCMCQVCGTYMVQDEKGLNSRCVCPTCLAVCNACMGASQEPASPDQLKWMLLERARIDANREREDS